MAGFHRDKYFILCSAVAFIIMSSLLFSESSGSSGTVVMVHDVSESSSGFTFDAETSDGTVFRCFCRVSPGDGDVCFIDGSWSDDRTIYFVSSLTTLLS